jgi:hypothetical protein
LIFRVFSASSVLSARCFYLLLVSESRQSRAMQSRRCSRQGPPVTWPGQQGSSAGSQGHSRFGDPDIVWRTLEAQAAEAALDVVAGLSLGAVVSAQSTLVQVWGEERRDAQKGPSLNHCSHAGGLGLRAVAPNSDNTAHMSPCAICAPSHQLCNQ